MELTAENKAYIDSKDYYFLIRRVGPDGRPWFSGETSKYWDERVALLNPDNQNAFAASKKATP